MSNIGNKETMAKNLKYYMDRNNVNQSEMARIVGVATSTFNDWIKARKYPRINKIEIMAAYFGIQKSDLIEEKENTPISERDKSIETIMNLFRKLDDSQKMELLTFALELIDRNEKEESTGFPSSAPDSK